MVMQLRRHVGILVIGIGAAALASPVARAQEPARTDGWVVLALDDYRALRARAFPSTPDPLPPPRRCHADACRLRAEGEWRQRDRRGAADDRRP